MLFWNSVALFAMPTAYVGLCHLRSLRTLRRVVFLTFELVVQQTHDHGYRGG